MRTSLLNITIIVTGGTAGLGKSLAESLAACNANVVVLTRGPRSNVEGSGITTIIGDVTNKEFMNKTVRELKPSILILNAGATPVMGPIDEQTWETFSTVWNTDVKAGLHGIQAALNAPLPKASRVLIVASGAAMIGAPLSGSYAGAKRMLWFMANYANEISREKKLGIHFQTLVPMQMIGETALAKEVAGAYARRAGLTINEHIVKKYGSLLSATEYAEHVVTLLTDASYVTGSAYGIKSQSGVTLLEN